MVTVARRSKRKVKLVRRPKRKVTRLTGSIEWDEDPGKVLTAIFREGGVPEPYERDIAIRCTFENLKTYEIGLDHIKDGFYRGSYTASLGKEKWTGLVSCNLLRSPHAIRLLGKWEERPKIYSWTAELTPVVSTKAKARRRRRHR